MESKIPLPTDNIYKFYALFGLVLLVFSIGASLYVIRSTNTVMTSLFIERETLSQQASLSPVDQVRKALIERQMEVAQADKKVLLWALLGLTAIGTVGMFYGFDKWHSKVQPLNDETARVHLEIAKLQLEKLKVDREAAGSPAAT